MNESIQYWMKLLILKRIIYFFWILIKRISWKFTPPDTITYIFKLDWMVVTLNRPNQQRFRSLHLNSFTWRLHFNVICKKAAWTCYHIYQLRKVLGRSALILLSCFFLVHNSYAISAWIWVSDAERDFKLQKRVVRSITSIKKNNQIFKELRILSLPYQYYFSLLIYTKSNQKPHKSLKHKSHLYYK